MNSSPKNYQVISVSKIRCSHGFLIAVTSCYNAKYRVVNARGRQFCTGMLKVDFRISTISIPRKVWFCDQSLLLQKTPNLEQIGCFFGQIFQNAPILQIGCIGSVTETHPSIYQKWAKKNILKPLRIPVYHQPVRAPGSICNAWWTGVHTYPGETDKWHKRMVKSERQSIHISILLIEPSFVRAHQSWHWY